MANIKLTANEKQFVSAMDRSAGAVGRLSAELNIKLARALRETDAISKNFQKGFGQVGEKIKQVGQTLTTSLTLPLSLAAGAMAKTYGDIDQLKRGLDAYGISLETIKKTAKLPGLGIEEAAQSSITFASVKFAADLSTKAVREFGNALVSSGKGKEELAGIATAFAQMKGKGGVMAEEVNQIAERLPMIRDLMQQAFGTSDTEALQKMGISADMFLEKIVAQLEKLPRVSGGFKTAWENVIDSLKIGSYEAFNTADKLFNLTGILNSLSGYIDNAVQSFKQLSPEVQTAIFVIGGLALAAGPVITAIGFIVGSVIPTFLAGLATISAPMLGVAAVVGVAVANIIKYWDKIKYVLTETGIWDGVAVIFKTGLDYLNNIVGVFYSLFTADWAGFWKNLKTIVARLWNSLVEIIVIPFKALFEFQRLAANAFGFKTLSNGATTVLGWIDAIADNVKAKIPESTNYIKKFSDAVANVGGGGKTGNIGGTSNQDLLKKLQEQRDILGKLNLKEISSNATESYNKVFGAKQEPTFFQDLINAGERLKQRLPKVLAQVDLSQAGLTIEQQIQKNIADKAKLAFLETQFMIDEMAKNLALNALPDALASVFESIGSGDGIAKGLGNAFKSILSTIGQYMIDLGKKTLIATTLIENLKKAFGTVAGPGAAIALIAGGGLLKGLANNLFSSTPKFAQGGMVLGPTLAVMGDNASGREMALPWEKTGVFAQAIASNLGGGIGGGVYRLEARGEDLVAVIDKYNRRTGR